MTAETRRQGLLLAVLLVVLAGVLWWNVRGAATVPPEATARPATGAPDAAAAAGETVENVRLEALDTAPPEPAAAHRNPFRFGARRTSPPAGAFEPPAPYVAPLPLPDDAQRQAAGTAPIPLKFIGVVTEAQPDRKLAVLSDGRNPPFYGRVGDIIEGRYRIVRIGVESIELAHLDGRGQQTIRLSGS